MAKDVDKPPKARIAARPRDRITGPRDPRSDAADFTPAQWKWLKARTAEFEKDYRPTRWLIEGL